MPDMGTIRDARDWLTDTLGGDAPRANSMLKVGQTKGLLTSWGRKPVSARLVLTDFAALICMALMTEGPTKAPEVVDRLWGLPLSLLTVDPGDGTERQIKPERAATMDEELGPLLAPYLGPRAVRDLFDRASRKSCNLIGVLTRLFVGFAPKADFHRYDLLRMEQAADRLAVHLTLHGPRYGIGLDGYRSEGEDAFMVRLTFGDLAVFSGRAVETSRTLLADALNALAALTRNEEAE